MLSIKGIEEGKEGGLRGIRWIITAKEATTTRATAITQAPETEKSTNNEEEPLKWNEKINTPTTFFNKKCY